MWQDIQYATRGFRKTPIFTAVAIVTLTLAIGANTAIFSLLNALVLRDARVREPQTLVQVSSLNAQGFEGGFTYPMYDDFKRRQVTFSSVMGWNWGNYNITTDGALARGTVSSVSGNYFEQLGARPVIGRLIGPDDVNEASGNPAMVAVIGHTYWRARLGGDPGVIGRQVIMEATPFTIIGVAPPDFLGLALVVESDVTIPLTAFPQFSTFVSADLKTGASMWVRITGRLKPDVTLAQARASIESFWPQLKAEHVPAEFTDGRRDRFLASGLSVQSAAKGVEPGMGLRSRFTRPLYIVLAIAMLVLLIACVNLASLMVARGAAKSHEVGVRLALGAARFRVMRAFVVEGLLLAAAGAIAGVVFALWITDLLASVILRDYVIRATLDVAPDARVAAFTAAVAAAVGIMFSLVPAWRAGRQDVTVSLRQGARTVTSTGRAGRVLVAVQVGLSLVLLTHAGLLVRSLQQVRNVSSGIQGERVFVAYPYEMPGGYRNVDNDTYYPNLVTRLESLPGVERAAISNFKPAGGGTSGELVSRVQDAAGAGGVASAFMSVSPNLFDVLGIALRSGRDFTWSDHSQSRRVAIVSETLARRLFPDTAVIGQRVRIGVLPQRQDLEIVGVVADAHIYDLKDPNLASLYVPSLQEPGLVDGKCFVIRGSNVPFADLKTVVASFGHESVDAAQGQSLDYIVGRVLLQDRLIAAFATFFGIIALLLAAVGVYGLMSYETAQRRREIGIRVALGAVPGRILRAVVGDGLMVAALGLAVGAVAATTSARLVGSLIFGISAHDPLTFALAPTALLAIAVAACLGPALRASRIDPVATLRTE